MEEEGSRKIRRKKLRKEKSKFDRVLSQKDVLAMSFGAMIGWSWIVMTGDWIQTAGTLGAIIAFLIGGLMVIFVGLTYAELTSAMPKAGGEMVFSKRALGRNISFICTWSIILGYISVVAFEAVALPTVVEYLFPNYVQGYMYTIAGYDVNLTWVLVGMVSSIIMTIVNYIGIKPAAFMQSIFTTLIIVVGLIFLFGAFGNGTVDNVEPLFIDGSKGVLSVAVMTPFLFVGFDVIPQVAEEINMPFKKIGRILIISILVAIFWYCMIIFGVSLALDDAQINASSLVTADAMKSVFFNSNFASKVMVVAGIAGIISSWNSFFVGGSRAIYAMAEEKMLPGFLAKLHPKYNTPTNAILLVGIITTLAPLLGRKMLNWLMNAGGFTVVLAYMIVVISFLVLRKKEPNMARPYKIKNGMIIGVIAIILCLFLFILYMPGSPSALMWPYEWGIIFVWELIGIIFFFWARSTYKVKG